jgi:hypothetical protein
VVRAFYEAFVFWDTKRPVTADLLRRLDLQRLAEEIRWGEEFKRHFGEPERLLFT